jgi:hypothetical protein
VISDLSMRRRGGRAESAVDPEEGRGCSGFEELAIQGGVKEFLELTKGAGRKEQEQEKERGDVRDRDALP